MNFVGYREKVLTMQVGSTVWFGIGTYSKQHKYTQTQSLIAKLLQILIRFANSINK